MTRRHLSASLFAITALLAGCSRESSDRAAGDAVPAASEAERPLPAPAPILDDTRGRALITGAGGAVERSAKMAPQAAAAPAPPSLPTATSSVQLTGTEALAAPMLIRTGQASIRVDSLDAGVARIRQLAARVGALVANTSVSAGDAQHGSATLELRVPSERFDELVTGLAPLGKVEEVNIQVQDVGEEYTDVAARVANARRLEARLVELLANRTGRLADVLTVERELARVREEIERYEGRMRYLRTRASVSSLTVTVHERVPIVAGPAGRNPIAEAFREAWRRFVWLVAAFIASLGVLVPVAVLGVGAWVMLKRVRKVRAQET